MGIDQGVSIRNMANCQDIEIDSDQKAKERERCEMTMGQA